MTKVTHLIVYPAKTQTSFDTIQVGSKSLLFTESGANDSLLLRVHTEDFDQTAQISIHSV